MFHISSSSFPLVTSIRMFDLNIELFYPKLQKGKRAERFYELMGFLYYVYGWKNPHKELSMFLKFWLAINLYVFSGKKVMLIEDFDFSKN